MGFLLLQHANSRFSFDSTIVLSISELTPCVPRFCATTTQILTTHNIAMHFLATHSFNLTIKKILTKFLFKIYFAINLFIIVRGFAKYYLILVGFFSMPPCSYITYKHKLYLVCKSTSRPN